LLKETAGAVDWAHTHDLQASTNYETNTLPTAPRRPLNTN